MFQITSRGSVLCDLSIDNANVYYEVGIRHLRKRGVVHIQAGRAYMPFDISTCAPFPTILQQKQTQPLLSDIQAIARMTKTTWASDRDAIQSNFQPAY
jgi:hypothetical protein